MWTWAFWRGCGGSGWISECDWDMLVRYRPAALGLSTPLFLRIGTLFFGH